MFLFLFLFLFLFKLLSHSQLARLQLFSAGSHTDDLYFSDTASVSSGNYYSTIRNVYIMCIQISVLQVIDVLL